MIRGLWCVCCAPEERVGPGCKLSAFAVLRVCFWDKRAAAEAGGVINCIRVFRTTVYGTRAAARRPSPLCYANKCRVKICPTCRNGRLKTLEPRNYARHVIPAEKRKKWKKIEKIAAVEFSERGRRLFLFSASRGSSCVAARSTTRQWPTRG